MQPRERRYPRPSHAAEHLKVGAKVLTTADGPGGLAIPGPGWSDVAVDNRRLDGTETKDAAMLPE